eukprot:390748_1
MSTKTTNDKKMQLRNKLKQKVIAYRNVIIKGCGNLQCKNPYCKSNTVNQDKKYAAVEASKLALKMLKLKIKNCDQYHTKQQEINNLLNFSANIINAQNYHKQELIINRIKNATNPLDLEIYFIPLNIPLDKFLTNFTNINKLKKILLHKISEGTYDIHKTYILSSSLSEICCDGILVNIIKYLNYKEYAIINLLSKQFNKIMKENICIYNKYSLYIVCNNYLWNKKFVLNHRQKLFTIDHGDTLLINKNIDKIQYFKNDLYKLFNWFILKKLIINYQPKASNN